MLNKKFWKNKKVLITGHTGFKGAWLSIWLSSLGSKITGISLPSTTNPNLFSLAKIKKLVNHYYCDINDYNKLSKIISKTNPEVIFHLAAQSLVIESYRYPKETYLTNIIGTINVLESAKLAQNLKAIVVTTTDKVYKNVKKKISFKETDLLGGYDHYSSSKAATEIVIDSYRNSFFLKKNISIASARSGNIIGGGDWSKDRIIPDAIKAWEKNKILTVRQPKSIRPWQHVLDPIFGYIILAQKITLNKKLSDAYNFGPNLKESISVRSLVNLAKKYYGKGKISWRTNKQKMHESEWLGLNTKKTYKVLGFKNNLNLNQTIKNTIYWYKTFKVCKDIKKMCEYEIRKYLEKKE